MQPFEYLRNLYYRANYLLQETRPLTRGSQARLLIFHAMRHFRLIPRRNMTHLTVRIRHWGALTIRAGTSDMGTLHEVFVHRFYSNIVPHLKRCETIIDLGANIGMVSCFVAKHYSNVHTIAVDPDVYTYTALEQNLARLTMPHQIVRAGVWSSDRGIARQSEDRIDFHFVPRGADDTDQPDDVLPSVTMQQLVQMLPVARIDLLKVDVEGAETEMFHGDLSWLDLVQCMAIEFHNGTRQQVGFDALMAARGFEIVADGPHTVVAVRKRPPAASTKKG